MPHPDYFHNSLLRKDVQSRILDQIQASGLDKGQYSAYLVGDMAGERSKAYSPFQVVVTINNGMSSDDFNEQIGKYLQTITFPELGRKCEFVFKNGLIDLGDHNVVYDIGNSVWFKGDPREKKVAQKIPGCPVSERVLQEILHKKSHADLHQGGGFYIGKWKVPQELIDSEIRRRKQLRSIDLESNEQKANEKIFQLRQKKKQAQTSIGSGGQKIRIVDQSTDPVTMQEFRFKMPQGITPKQLDETLLEHYPYGIHIKHPDPNTYNVYIYPQHSAELFDILDHLSNLVGTTDKPLPFIKPPILPNQDTDTFDFRLPTGVTKQNVELFFRDNEAPPFMIEDYGSKTVRVTGYMRDIEALKKLTQFFFDETNSPEHKTFTPIIPESKVAEKKEALYSESGDNTQRTGTVYLLHFDEPYHHARHYVGFTEHLEQRLHTHDKNGNPLISAVNAAGIPWRVSRIWENVKQGYERYLKSQHNISRVCPICLQEKQVRQADREPSKICVMAKLPDKDAQGILELVNQIPEEDLYKEGDEYGREEETHTTILYGLLPDQVTIEDIKEKLNGYGEIEITLGKISKFKNKDKPYDVLKIDVESTDLGALNERLKTLPNENDYNDFSPHITLGYVRRERQEQLIGDSRFEGDRAVINEVVFSPGNGDEKTTIPLNKKRIAYKEYWLTPDAKLERASQSHMQWLLDNKVIENYGSFGSYDEGYFKAFNKGYIRVVEERNPAFGKSELLYEGYPKPNQLKELKDYAIEMGLDLKKAIKKALSNKKKKTKYYALSNK